MRISYTGLVSLVLAASLASASPVLGPITNPANGHDYYLLEASTWTAAEAEAVSLGGHLVTINDAAEDDWLYTTELGAAAHRWIGFTDAGHEGVWEWISGEPVTYTKWSPGSPNNTGGIEHYGEWDHNGWNDVPNDGWGVPHQGIVEVVPEGGASVIEIGPFSGQFSEGFETLPHRVHRQEWDVFNDTVIVRSIGSGSGLYTAEFVGALPGGETRPHTGEVFLFPNGVNAEWVFDTSAEAFGGYFTTLNSTDTIADGVARFFDINDNLIGEHSVTAPKGNQWVWNGWTSDIPINRVEILGNSTQRTGYVMHDDMEYTPSPDCNGNMIPDSCDLDCGDAGGGCDLPGCGDANDCDMNGIPDECDGNVVNAWSMYRTPDSGHGSTYVPLLENYHGIPFIDNVADAQDAHWIVTSSGQTQYTNTTWMFHTTLSVSNALALPYYFGGDDGHSLYVNGEFIFGGGFGESITDTLHLDAGENDLTVLLHNSGGPYGVHLSAGPTEGWTLLGERQGLTMTAPQFEEVLDCNGNGILDACDIVDGNSQDCNGNGVPDECDLFFCDDGNGCTDDYCDTALGCLNDGTGITVGCDDGNACTTNDVCQGDAAGTCGGTLADADGDGVCDANDTCPGGDDNIDCQPNGVPDYCDIEDDTSQDCNSNGVPDECDIADCVDDPTCDDCDENGIPDGCDADCDGDGLIDECDPDIDEDGVLNADDVCDFTPPSEHVEPDGSLLGDLDGDCDVDLDDFALIQTRFTGAGCSH